MGSLSQITWLTLWGLSLLFVGGFVLWVYATQKPRLSAIPSQDMVAPSPHAHLVHWFVLYGALATFAGLGCLLTAAIMLI